MHGPRSAARSGNTWNAGYFIIGMLCSLELALAVLVPLDNFVHTLPIEGAIFVILLLTYVSGLITKPIAWLTLILIWRNKDAPRRATMVWTVVLAIATLIFLRIFWAGKHFKT